MSSLEKIGLKAFLESIGEEETISVFKKFHCQDKSINEFLVLRAIEFEKANKARTYLYMDYDNECVAGFFSISNQILEIPYEKNDEKIWSIRKRKILDGFSGKANDKILTEFHVYLIGQLARDERCSKEVLPGKKILEDAIDVILEVQELIGGRAVLVECRKELIKFYQSDGFEELYIITDTSSSDSTRHKLLKYLGTPYIANIKKS